MGRVERAVAVVGEQVVDVVEGEGERGRGVDQWEYGQAAEGGVLRKGAGERGNGICCRGIWVKEVGSGLDSAGGGVEKGGIEVNGVSAWVVAVAAIERPVDAGEVSLPGVVEEEFCGGRGESLRLVGALAVLVAVEEAPEFVHFEARLAVRSPMLPGFCCQARGRLIPFDHEQRRRIVAW